MTDASKTSVYLPGDLKERIAASGRKPAELIRLGLDAADAGNLIDAVRAAVREELAPLAERLDGLERAVAAAVVPPGDGAQEALTARTEPQRAAVKSGTRARSVDAATAALKDGNTGAALRALRSVTPATAVFREPGGDPVTAHPVPEAADHSAKAGLRKAARP